MEQIEIKKRTPKERAAYIEGFEAGQRDMQFSNSPKLIIQMKALLRRNDRLALLQDLQLQAESGIVLLEPYTEFVTCIPNAEYEVVLKEQGE